MNQRVRILIAEDSPTQAVKLAMLLERAGYQPKVANNGREALDKLRQEPAALVISDVMMPEMTGYELCAALKQDPALAPTPVILLTSLNDTEDVIRGLEHQADYYVTKPYDEQYLLTKVNAIVSGQEKVELEGDELVVSIGGRQHQVPADRRQMLNLLLSTYENAVLQNRELGRTRDQLEVTNARLADNLSELAASEMRFRSLVQTVPDIVYRLNPEGEFTFINEAISRLGYEPRDLIGRHFSCIIEPSEVKQVSRDEVLPRFRGVATGNQSAPKLFDERRSGERKTTGLEVKLLCKHSDVPQPGLIEPLTDDLLYAEVSSAGLHQDDVPSAAQFFIGTVGVIRDITVRKRMEKDLEKANLELERKVAERTSSLEASNQALQEEIAQRGKAEAELKQSLQEIKRAQAETREMEMQLRQSQKMEAVGTLAGGIAHDFNNILSVMMGYAELALDDARKGLVSPGDLEEVINSAKRAKGLIKQILTFSHRMEPEFKPLEINKEVVMVANLLRSTLPKMIQVHLSLSPELPLIKGDPYQIQQMMMNLGTNARDAMPDGGELTLATALEDVDGLNCMACSSNFSGRYITLSVSDNGTGIQNDVLHRIFEPFYTTKEVGKGTGLGLATVFGIAKAHSGHLTCRSQADQGTVFTAYLPADENVMAAAPLEEPQYGPGPGGDETVLLVDDEEHLLKIGQTHLSKAGYQVLRASSGEEALEVYRSHRGEVDLVVLDLSMPGMGGSKCLEQLLALDPNTRVIIASGYSRGGDLHQTLSDKAVGLLPKPFSKDEMLRTVRMALDA
ncbi:MAG: response regulator [Desulfarculaceae bacterium]|nr:response regulator [Desulfarculaceae bacterium]MCF8072821.1 response regulator [Desulfarculaceae bacterium]MCF8100989.1 response regulator [Desulfarculaceae bacterium]MCF8115624.1 response regulator [Desulfarculaceae bacterium]